MSKWSFEFRVTWLIETDRIDRTLDDWETVLRDDVREAVSYPLTEVWGGCISYWDVN